MHLSSTRAVDLFAFFICCGLVMFSFYLEVYVGLALCPLCVIQRVLILLLGLLFLFGSLIDFRKTGRRVYHFIIFLVAVLGVIVAGRHVWLTSLPQGQAPPCGAGISYMLQVLPVNKVIEIIFQGSGDCDKITWTFLNLSIPNCALIFFIFFALLALWQVAKKERLSLVI